MNGTVFENGVGKPIDLSVLIPTRNGGSIFRQLMAMAEQQILEGSVEYVIVDSGCVDGTDAMASARGWRVIHVSPAEFNHGRTRNLGMSRPSGRYVALMTQDALPADKNLFRNLVVPFTDPEVGGVCARQVPRADADPITCRNMAKWPETSSQPRISSAKTVEGLRRMLPHEQYMNCRFDNVCAAVRRKVWIQQPFPEIDFGEDLAWGFQVVCGGRIIYYQPQVVVIHSHDRSSWYEYKRAYCFAWQIENLFGIHHLPTLSSATNRAIKHILNDPQFLCRIPMLPSKKWEIGLRSTLRTAAGGAGQYLGARDRRRSLKRVMKGV